MESQRLPNKPLALIGGIPLVIRVWQQATLAKSFDSLAIATDSDEIAKVCQEYGALVLFTSNKPRNGTERVYEALAALPNYKEFDVVLNVQGDMPFIVPEVIDTVVAKFLEKLDSFDMATLCLPIKSEEEYQAQSCVKVAFDLNKKALYFSRSAIPHYRDLTNKPEILAYKHIGLYAFKAESLAKIVSFEPTPLELAESLEQLRALEHGMSILLVAVDRSLAGPSIEVDTESDLEKARQTAESS
jgi:3-deoxy-manno-octulosonate cytidylyltransferase (CMP-KDO synthetase)